MRSIFVILGLCLAGTASAAETIHVTTYDAQDYIIEDRVYAVEGRDLLKRWDTAFRSAERAWQGAQQCKECERPRREFVDACQTLHGVVQRLEEVGPPKLKQPCEWCGPPVGRVVEAGPDAALRIVCDFHEGPDDGSRGGAPDNAASERAKLQVGGCLEHDTRGVEPGVCYDTDDPIGLH